MKNKLLMRTPLVEMDGDEMARVLWTMIKEKLILPYVDLKCEYYDLGLVNRNDTDDTVSMAAALATKRLGVAVKCATITPNKKRLEEYSWLKSMYKSPNATIRSVLDGTVFRRPIIIEKIKPAVRTWEKPITIARHAYGDVYKAIELQENRAGECRLSFIDETGIEETISVQKTNGAAVFQAMHNTDASIESFARSCFQYAIDTKQDLWFSTKDTISKTYDGRFRDIFESIFSDYKESFNDLGLRYFYTLIDDAVARVIRSKGGFVWACKNYDGDIMSDMVSSAFGSLALMTSTLVSPDGCVLYEAAHGTITKHYYRHLKGEKTSTNPTAMIFAWSGALRKRGEIDGLPELVSFADSLEAVVLDTINDGIMTADMASLSEETGPIKIMNSEAFLDEISERLALQL